MSLKNFKQGKNYKYNRNVYYVVMLYLTALSSGSVMNEPSLNKTAFSHSKKVQLMTSKNTFQMHTSPILLDTLFFGLPQTA